MKIFWKRFLSMLIGTAMSVLQPLMVFAEENDKPKAQILLEMNTGTVLFEENADEPLPMASITKLMGLILVGEAIENGELSRDDMLTCSDYAKTMGGSEIWLKAGEQMSVDDLLKAILIGSANDAMVVVAEKLGGTEDGFVKLMNQKAAELGLKNTNFINCTGFDEDGHYTSARDVATLALELQAYPELLEYAMVWMDSLRNGETMLVNTNRLVRFYEGCTGLKTGTTDAAGHCLCATAKREELELCAVVLGCKSSDERFEATKELLNYGFGNYCVYKAEEPVLEPLPVVHGTAEQVKLKATPPESIVLTKEDAADITVEIPQLKEITAPVSEGQLLGEVHLLSGGKEIASWPITADETVEELSFTKCWNLLWAGVMSME